MWYDDEDAWMALHWFGVTDTFAWLGLGFGIVFYLSKIPHGYVASGYRRWHCLRLVLCITTSIVQYDCNK
jgi:hypothetical protein